MITPVRCFSWDKVIGDKWVSFRKRVVEGERPRGVLDDFGLQKYCCGRMLLSNVEIIDEILRVYDDMREKWSRVENAVSHLSGDQA